MKNIIHLIICISFVFVFFSCNNDFLNEEPEPYSLVGSAIIISPDWEAKDYNIYCEGVGNAKFTVAHVPSWLKISSMTGQFTDNCAIINCKANAYSVYSEIGIYYLSMILSIEGKGNIRIPISYIVEGNPVIEADNYMTTYNIYGVPIFGRLSVGNTGNGILLLTFSELPEWLSLKYNSTMSNNNSIYTICSNQEGYFDFSFKDIPIHENTSGKIVLTTNDKNTPQIEIDLFKNIKPITGKVTDACLDRQSDILYLTTNEPNRFLAYDTKNRTAREIPLPHVPNCFSISEDGQKAIIGHNKYITSINILDFSIIKTIEVNYDIFDIEWGVDNWCCYTPMQQVEDYTLQWKNLDTEETYNTPYSAYSWLNGKSYIKKIPGQNNIVASRLTVSPSSVTIFDKQTRNVVKYYHESVGNFWLSSEGNSLVSQNFQGIYNISSFFKTPDIDITFTNKPTINTFSPEPYWIIWIDYHETSHNVWVLTPLDFWNEEKSVIMQYTDSKYTHVETYYSEYHYIGKPTRAHYVFANKAGTELIVIRNITNGVSWSLEFIPIEEL